MRRESKQVFAKFEAAALAESAKLDNANRELALYYLEHTREFSKGLRVAELEASRRRDVHTLEVYAKALRLNGKVSAARNALTESKERLNARG